MAIHKGVQFYQETKALKGYKLMNVFLYDQIFYFIMFVSYMYYSSFDDTDGTLYRILCCSLATVLAYCYDDAQMGAFLSFTNATLPSLLGARILLNLRAVGESTGEIGTDVAPRLSQLAAISDIRLS